MEAM
jgi:kinesin family protein 6/9